MIKLINAVLWGVALVVLLGGGLYFSVKLKFPQLKTTFLILKNFITALIIIDNLLSVSKYLL